MVRSRLSERRFGTCSSRCPGPRLTHVVPLELIIADSSAACLASATGTVSSKTQGEEPARGAEGNPNLPRCIGQGRAGPPDPDPGPLLSLSFHRVNIVFIALLEATWSTRAKQPGAATREPPALPAHSDGPHAAVRAQDWMGRGRTFGHPLWSPSLVTQSHLGGPWGLLVQPQAVTAACLVHVNPKSLQMKPRNHETWGLGAICLPRSGWVLHNGAGGRWWFPHCIFPTFLLQGRRVNGHSCSSGE